MPSNPGSNPSMDVMSRRKRALFGAGLGLLVALLLTVMRRSEALERPELALVDVRTQTFVRTRDPDPRIVMAVVTETEIKRAKEEFGIRTWPWSQDIQTYVVRFMKFAGVKSLVLDFMYLDRGVDPNVLEKSPHEGLAGQFEDELVNAREFGDELRTFGHAAVGVDLVPYDPVWQLPSREDVAIVHNRISVVGDVPSRFARGAAELPVKAILSGAGTIGFVTVKDDVDGVVRRADVIGYWDGERIDRQATTSMAFAGAEMLVDGDTRIWQQGGVTFAGVGDERQRLGEDGSFLVNFRGQPFETYRTVSVYDMMVAGSNLDKDEPSPDNLDEYQLQLAKSLEGTLVIWGASYQAALDEIPTPVNPSFLGPEFHATAIDNLLHGDGRVPIGRTNSALILIWICMTLGIYGTIDRSRIRPYMVALLCVVLYVGMAFWLFRRGWSVDMFTPMVGIVLTAVATAIFRLSTEGKRNKWLEHTFSRYLSPEVIGALKTDPSRLQLGGRRADLTIFFSDVAGFTSLSEALEPEQVVALLNRYLTGQSDELMKQKGVIDKFEGDAIMAFFGDPLETPTHAVDGCRAAVRCRKALPSLETFWRSLGLPGFEIRIGINSGPVIVGNLGSETRFDYTCMGDTVNLAARLEGANKAFGSKILIGARTYEEAKDEILVKPLADLVVVGKTEAPPVYELYAMQDEATDEERAHVEAFARAHAALRAGDVPGARAALDEAGETSPGDGPVAWLRAIADAVEAGDLDTPWDGRLELFSK